MKILNAMRVGVILFSLTAAACSSSDGDGGTAASLQEDTIAAVSDTLTETEKALASSGEAEQNAVDANDSQETP